jgi:hypothetical protein
MGMSQVPVARTRSRKEATPVEEMVLGRAAGVLVAIALRLLGGRPEVVGAPC